jgi:hypothetical protein
MSVAVAVEFIVCVPSLQNETACTDNYRTGPGLCPWQKQARACTYLA